MARRITVEDRVKIEVLLRQGVKFSDIANQLSVRRSATEPWNNQVKAKLCKVRTCQNKGK